MKYYFGYVRGFNKPHSVKWTEDGGSTIGGSFDRVQFRELSKEEYLTMSLAICEATWPYKAPS